MRLIFVLLLLSACTTDSGPFAPGIAGDAQGDQMVVGHRMMAGQEYELALRAFTRAAARQGPTTQIMGAIGTANLALGRLGQAEQVLRRVIQAEDATPEIWNNLGVVLMEKGEYPEAAQMFRRAFALSSGASPTIRDNLAQALAKRDNTPYAGSNDSGPQLIHRGTGNVLLVTQ